jgi:hypothetical protein
VGLGGLHPSRLAEVLVVRLTPNSCLDVGSDGGVRLLVEIGVPYHGRNSILEGPSLTEWRASHGDDDPAARVASFQVQVAGDLASGCASVDDRSDFAGLGELLKGLKVLVALLEVSIRNV